MLMEGGTGVTGQRVRDRLTRLVRSGSRTVLLTPAPGPRFGNFLYFWLHAHALQRAGRDYVVRTPDYMGEWLDLLPFVRERLTVPFTGIRPWDRREWPEETFLQRFGTDFSPDDLERFVTDALLDSPLLTQSVSSAPEIAEDEVVVNVRRGDYYSDPVFRERFGFDVPAYLAAAAATLAELGPIERVHIVSDDPEWCGQHLSRASWWGTEDVTVVPGTDTAADNFRMIASARRLIGTNSTFSYWGAYVATVRHGARVEVVMPAFHARGINKGLAYQLDPRWLVVAEPPGGWRARLP